jgi:hypothetical protein
MSYAPRKLVLAINEALRKDRRTFALPDHSGHVFFQCPVLDYYAWTKKYPELGASDPQIARRAWLKFLNTDEGAQYKINPYDGRKRYRVPLLSK